MSADLTPYLRLMANKNASDLFLTVGAPPNIKIDGETLPLSEPPLDSESLHKLAYSVMNEHQQREFEATLEMNLALGMPTIGRFRVNVYRQRGELALALRYITNHIPSLQELNLPTVLHELIMIPRGLVLVVGSTGSGKSTTLASMIDYRNSVRTGHILTVEEPIEYVHEHKKSMVDQREVGLDTMSYANALKNAMREAPDVIMIGEIRDRETMQAAISYAETGHLCLSTLHANNANQTLDRIINFFPETAHHQLLIDLSLNLRAVVSQRLLRGINQKRVPAVEILMGTAFVADLIAKGEIAAVREAMKQGEQHGMQTFDESLYQLYASGRITYQEALAHADSRTDLSLRIRLQGPQPGLAIHNVGSDGEGPMRLEGMT
ncbi:MAG: PilT/PilU family type 4a pilus ATPase [Ahniella sp.]|nr:PilT/PilU family type 4a pilus ATPase [Ahniella sp.]